LSTYIQQISIGAIIIFAVAIDTLRVNFMNRKR
jgi:ribose/xylose/arabinose/galactoside ABC-type transport system permease subunit